MIFTFLGKLKQIYGRKFDPSIEGNIVRRQFKIILFFYSLKGSLQLKLLNRVLVMENLIVENVGEAFNFLLQFYTALVA